MAGRSETRGAGRIAAAAVTLFGLFGLSALPAAAAPQGTIVPGGAFVKFFSSGYPYYPPELTAYTAVAIASGLDHVLIVTDAGAVVGYGSNDSGQTTVPASLSGQRVKAVAAGDETSLALTTDGKVVAWGNNTYGQSNVPAGLPPVKAIAASAVQGLALTTDGSVVEWGYMDSPESKVPAALTGPNAGVTAIAGGWNHNLALTADGKVVSWGNGKTDPPAELSNKTVTAISGGKFLSVAVTSDGNVFTWNRDGELAEPTIPDGQTVIAVAAGEDQALALTSSGTVYVWYVYRPDWATIQPTGLSSGVTAISTDWTYGSAIVATLPKVTASPVSKDVPAGQSVTFTAAATGKATPSVQWQRQSAGSSTWTDIPGARSTSYTLTAALADTGTRYQAVFSNGAGNATSDPATLTVRPTAPVLTQSPSAQTVPTGYKVTFTAAATGAPTPTVQWQQRIRGSSTWTDIPGAASASYSLTAAMADNGNQYRAIFTNPAGTVSSDPATLTVTAQKHSDPGPTSTPTTPTTPATPASASELAATGSAPSVALWLTAALLATGLALLPISRARRH